MQKDVNWWLEYIRTFNGVNFIINPSTTGLLVVGEVSMVKNTAADFFHTQCLAKALLLST